MAEKRSRPRRRPDAGRLASDETETPPELYHALAREHAGAEWFDLDAAASHENALAETYYTHDGYWVRTPSPQPDDGPDEVSVVVDQLGDANGLTGSWGWGTSVWVNPPYSDIEPWIVKAWQEMSKPAGTRPRVITMLLPARTDAPWWHRWVEPYRVGGTGADPHGVVLSARFYPRVEFLRHGRRIQATKNGEPVFNRNGTPRLSSARFGVVVLTWRSGDEKSPGAPPAREAY